MWEGSWAGAVSYLHETWVERGWGIVAEGYRYTHIIWADGVWPNLMMLPSAFDGGIDEVALYEEALPDELIVQHFSDAMSHQPYSSTVSPSARAVPPPADPAPQYDLQEYAPGTLLPTPEVTGCGLPHCVEQPTPGVATDSFQGQQKQQRKGLPTWTS